MLGIIFSNIHDSVMGDLTTDRTLASLPFGARYRQIDFVLSNMSNSGMNNIGIITKHHYQSLMDHLGSCGEWDLNRKNGGVFLLPPFGAGQTTVYKGKIDALRGSLRYIDMSADNYVLLSDSNVLCNIDYDEVLTSHKKSGADLTVICNKETEGKHDMVLTADEEGAVKELLVNADATEGCFVSMGMYIIDKRLLIEFVRTLTQRGFYHFERHFVQNGFLNNRLRLNLYEFEGVVLRNTDISQYTKNNMALIREDIRNGIFKPEAPIYTKVRDEVPTYYGDRSEVDDCIVADGCKIFGKVKNSVLFRNVYVGKDAVVEDCILMQGTYIEEGARLNNVICDKDVTVSSGNALQGAKEIPLIISKGTCV